MRTGLVCYCSRKIREVLKPFPTIRDLGGQGQCTFCSLENGWPQIKEGFGWHFKITGFKVIPTVHNMNNTYPFDNRYSLKAYSLPRDETQKTDEKTVDKNVDWLRKLKLICKSLGCSQHAVGLLARNVFSLASAPWDPRAPVRSLPAPLTCGKIWAVYWLSPVPMNTEYLLLFCNMLVKRLV